MIHLLNDIDILKKISASKFLLVFLDFDGTLAPIADRPENAYLPQQEQHLLQKLVEIPFCRTFVISGRALSDVKARVGIKGIGYVGNHGLEMDVPRVVFGNFDFTGTKEVLGFLKLEIGKVLPFFKGAFIEDKDVTLSVHYRLLEESRQEDFCRMLTEITKPFVMRDEVQIFFGKKVFEVRPHIDWNKGHAVLWLIEQQELLAGNAPVPIYIGDDRTDEDAFQALKGQGLTVKVGEGPSEAEYYLKSQQEVAEVLRKLLLFLNPSS